MLDHLEALASPLTASAVSVFEVLRGCRRSVETLAAEALFARIQCIGVDYASAAEAALLIREHPGVLSSERAVADAMIAGTAVASGLTLVTLNTRQFSRLQVAGLDVLAIDQTAPDWVSTVRGQS